MGYVIVESDLIEKVEDEFNRQVRLKEKGRFPHVPKDASLPDFVKLKILSKQLGEVAGCVFADAGLVQKPASMGNLHKELMQVTAIAIAWLKSPELK